MTAAKAIKSEGAAVVVDTTEQSQLPQVVKEAFASAGGSLPIVVFADPAMKTVYGTFNHATLRGQEYRSIFRDTKKKIREAIKDGSFSTDLAGTEDAEDEGDEETPVVAGRLNVEGSVVEDWESAKGTAIKAKLVGVEGDTVFYFETAEGREIKATSAQLSAESVKRAREMAGLE